MTGLVIAAAVILFLIFLFTVPFHIRVQADGDVRVWLRVLFVRLSLFPARRRKRPKKERQKREAPAKKKKQKKRPEREKKNILHMIRLVMKIAAAVIKKLSRHLRIRVHHYEISVATGDAAKTAILYGAVTGLSSTLFEFLKNTANFGVKRSAPVNVYADFVGEKTKAYIKIDFSIHLWGALVTLLAAGIAFVRNKNSKTDEQKGSMENG